MKKRIDICVEEKTKEKLNRLKEETGVPISQILERAFKKVYHN